MTRQMIMVLLLVMLVASPASIVSAGGLESAGIAGGVPADVPRIVQVGALPDGGLFVLTPEKGGLYRGRPGGTGWRVLPAVPKVFIHHVGVDSAGRMYLSSSDGLWRSRGEGWERVCSGPMAFARFGRDGVHAVLKTWGGGVRVARVAGLEADTVRRAEDQVERGRALELRSREVVARMGELSGDNVTSPEAMERLGYYRQWREIQDEINALDQARSDDLQAGAGALAASAVTCAAEAGDGSWLAGTFGQGILGKRPGHDQWRPCAPGPRNRWILAMATSPWGTVYAGTHGGGLWAWRSEESGWSHVSPLLDGSVIVDMAFGSSGRIAVATEDRGVFVSEDHGQSWIHGDVAGASAQSVAVDAAGRIWVGTWGAGLYLSEDQGKTWRHRPFAHVARVVGLAFGSHGTGYAALAGLGLFRSDDGGRDWAYVATPVRPAKDLGLALGARGDLYLASRGDGLWRSEDRGQTWARDMRGLPEGGVNHVAAMPGGLLLAVPADAAGLFTRSDDGSWRLVPMAGEDGWDYGVWETRLLPDGRYLAFGYQDIVISGDGGHAWRRERFGQGFRDLAMGVDGTIFTERMLTSFVLRPGPDNADWVKVDRIPGESCATFAPLGDGAWMGADRHGGILFFETRDGTATVVGKGLEGQRVLAMAAGPEGTVFVGLEDGLLVSRDRGRSWQKVGVIDEE